MKNNALVSYVTKMQGKEATRYHSLKIKDPQVLALYELYNPGASEWITGYTIVSLVDYARFCNWLTYTATPEDCLKVGFTEHQMMELWV